ncbi:DUF177 domain-containing protein [Halosquirtibacter laminarini]|uniref:DUF177 domain-containing protein n=1 Tax=Halosquirtibacter laminarini TaxID=3374600 RepID=A0AC61NE63_9BACT|nr:DUF177 domain-containing protein [Prolixibacteraceae bacterium]
MRQLSTYKILFSGLKEGIHEFEFTLDDCFFSFYKEGEILGGDVACRVILEKRTSLMTLTIQVNGDARVVCDRCLEEYNQNIKNEVSLFVKFGDPKTNMDDDIIYVDPDEYELELSQYLYEFTSLALPFRHVHPEDEQGNSMCNPEMLERLDCYSGDFDDSYEEDEVEEEEEVIDPRWNELKKIFDNKD